MTPQAVGAQKVLEFLHVLRDAGQDVGAEQRGARALPFADRGKHVGTQHYRHARKFALEDCLDLAFVRRIDYRPEQRNRHRLHVLALERPGRLDHGAVVERNQGVALVVDTLAHRQSQVTRDKVGRRSHVQVVAFGLIAVAEIDDVAKPLGAEQRGLGAVALDDRVGRDGRAVDEEVDAAKKTAKLESFGIGQVPQTFANPLGRLLRSGGFLPQNRPSLVVDHGKIRERSPDVDSDDVTHRFEPATKGRPY